MDESWRFRPSPPSICPTCYYSHFPFCNTPPPHFFHPRPPHDPSFPVNSPQPPLPIRGSHHPFSALHGGCKEEPWDRRVTSEEMAQREGFAKRMRVDERGMAGWSQFSPSGFGRLGFEDERRLSLIRDHGQQQLQRSQANRFAHEGVSNQFGSPMNPETELFRRNGWVPSTQLSGCLEGYRGPQIGARHGIDKFVNQENIRSLEIQRNANTNSNVNVDLENGSMVYRPQDSIVQYSNGYGHGRAGVGISERRMLFDQQHVECNAHKENLNLEQKPLHESWNHVSNEEFRNRCDGYDERQQRYLPHGATVPGTSSPYGNNYQAQTPPEVISENDHHKGCSPVHPIQFTRENVHQVKAHVGNVARLCTENKTRSSGDMHVLGQVGIHEYAVAKNSQFQSPMDGNRYLSASCVNDVAISVSSQVSNMPSYPQLPSPHLTAQLPEMSFSQLQQNNISPFVHQKSSKQYPQEENSFPSQHTIEKKVTLIDASHLFKKPHRATRPGHIAIILRGLPGSGKSYLAKTLRDLELENGGSAPRVHSMDDYFMTEVEKAEYDGRQSSKSVKGKKLIKKMVMEYCYEPEMEEAYRASMLKAFKKTVEEGIFTCVFVDDRNLRVADFAQFWAIGKSSGYEVYLLEAAYKDPIGCAARNVHGFSLDAIQKMAEKWEEAPSLYLQIDIQPLFDEDKLNDQSILEVDMDTEDVRSNENDASEMLNEVDQRTYLASEDPLQDARWAMEEESSDVKELGSSKWSKNTCDDAREKTDCKDHQNALSGLLQAYNQTGKSVRWGDKVEKRGFSIGVTIQSSLSSLIIGPGSGYNLNSNPVPKDEAVTGEGETDGQERHSTFLEHLRAEKQSFKAVFDKKRQRIGGLNDANGD